MGKKTKWLIFATPIIIVSLGLIIYFSYFHKEPSIDAKDWGAFGSYINPFVTLANVSLFIIFSILVYQYNRSIKTPILTFKTEVINGKETWQIINLGDGPALNLLISYKDAGNQDWDSPAVKSYSLGKNDKVDLDWLRGWPDIIGVYYKDIFNHEFIAMVGDDITEIRSYKNFKKLEINGHSFIKSDFTNLLKLKSVRITRMRIQRDVFGGSEASGSSSTTTETTNLNG